MEWISIKDKLPEHNQIILTCRQDRIWPPVVCVYKKDHVKNFLVANQPDMDFSSVTHWLTIPTLPIQSPQSPQE